MPIAQMLQKLLSYVSIIEMAIFPYANYHFFSFLIEDMS